MELVILGWRAECVQETFVSTSLRLLYDLSCMKIDTEGYCCFPRVSKVHFMKSVVSSTYSCINQVSGLLGYMQMTNQTVDISTRFASWDCSSHHPGLRNSLTCLFLKTTLLSCFPLVSLYHTVPWQRLHCIILFLDKDSTALVHNLVFKTCIQI